MVPNLAARLIYKTLVFGTQSSSPASCPYSTCRALPGDKAWPSVSDWNKLNATVGGRLIRGTPIAEVCYSNNEDGIVADSAACAVLQEQWPYVDPYLESPVNVMCPYWLNNTCSPFLASQGSCTLGNLASYAINVTGASDVIAGLKFVKEHNIRLTVKNTGHDILGRSTGAGSLALWTHHLKDVSFFDYSGPIYKGGAAKLGAGIQVGEAYEIASAHGYRVAAGGCPTVGLAGWMPGGGHGPLTASYGLGADNALEFEVITTDGHHLVASATQNSDLYWALAGGGAGNYAIVLSITAKAHKDGDVAGNTFMFYNTNTENYWKAIEAWVKHLLVLDSQYPTLKTAVTFTRDWFFLSFATWADKTSAELNAAMQPFHDDRTALGLDLVLNQTATHATFSEHYTYFTGVSPWGVNQTVGDRLVPRATAGKHAHELVSIIRSLTDEIPDSVFVFVAMNVTAKNAGIAPNANSVNPAWRDSLMLINMGRQLSPEAGWAEVSAQQAQVNGMQDAFRTLMPNGGGYLNEGTWDNPQWKADYFGSNYGRLAKIKAKYDPDYTLWTPTAVGNDAKWSVDLGTGRMCAKK
ncbi:FAD-binding domain-containing protein [Ustulina deusta]|nr:FAD-binding domain-containing protein [Ustulina deusta]